MAFNRKALSGSALIVLGVLLVAVLLLVNVLFRGARLDLTQGHLYTLSAGTRNILKSIDEPINLYFFYSDKGSQDIPQVRSYAARVREMLQEMAEKMGPGGPGAGGGLPPNFPGLPGGGLPAKFPGGLPGLPKGFPGLGGPGKKK